MNNMIFMTYADADRLGITDRSLRFDLQGRDGILVSDEVVERKAFEKGASLHLARTSWDRILDLESMEIRPAPVVSPAEEEMPNLTEIKNKANRIIKECLDLIQMIQKG